MITIQRITLAAERPELEQGVIRYCSDLFPDRPIDVLPLADFVETLDAAHDPAELKVLMLHADSDGHLDPGSTIVRSILASQVPVLVLRWDGTEPLAIPDITRIVVPLDGSMVAGQAIPLASRVAQTMQVPVHFVMVIDPSRVIPPAYAYDPDAWGMIEELRQTSHWALSQAEEAMRRDGVAVESDLLFGPINASLAASITAGDLVVMTTHGPVPRGSRQRESVVMRTLVAVPQPMLIKQAERETPIVVDGYQACSWAEPLRYDSTRTE